MSVYTLNTGSNISAPILCSNIFTSDINSILNTYNHNYSGCMCRSSIQISYPYIMLCHSYITSYLTRDQLIRQCSILNVGIPSLTLNYPLVINIKIEIPE